VIVHFVLHGLRWEVMFHFVDISGVFDHHCLNFLFIIVEIWMRCFNRSYSFNHFILC
jgi:hypothetical protein